MFRVKAKIAATGLILFTITSLNKSASCQVNVGISTVSTVSSKVISPADSAWSAMPLPTFKGGTAGRAVEFFTKDEMFRVAYREAGLKFWNAYPNDKRKYEWLARTVLLFPQYWKDIEKSAISRANSMNGPFEIDMEAVEEWDKIYPDMREEYMQSNQVSALQKTEFTRLDLAYYLNSRLNSRRRNDIKLDLSEPNKLFRKAIDSYYEMDTLANFDQLVVAPFRNIDVIFRYTDIFGLSDGDLVSFVENYKNDSHSPVREWANRKLSGLNLKKNPISFRSVSTTGKTFDLENLRGKVILLDFWATWCSTCIGRMPAIKKVYKAYKEQGFEVLSIAIDPLSNQKAVEKVERKIDAGWPLFIIGGKTPEDLPTSLYQKIWNQYGFSGVPQLLLLDKNGIIVKVNGDLQTGDFEPLVKHLLAQ